MKMTIDEYNVGDEVDVFPYDNDDFSEFTGSIVGINYDKGIIRVRDEDDDTYDVTASQIRLTYAETDDTVVA